MPSPKGKQFAPGVLRTATHEPREAVPEVRRSEEPELGYVAVRSPATLSDAEKVNGAAVNVVRK